MLIRLSFGLADDRFTQQVEGKCETLLSERCDCSQNFVDARPGDEPSSHPGGVGPRVIGQGSRQNRFRRQVLDSESNHLDRPGEMLADFEEVLLQMPGHFTVRTQSRQYVNKAKHLDFERLISHRRSENAFVPPSSFEDGRLPAGEVLPDIASDLLRSRFDGTFCNVNACR